MNFSKWNFSRIMKLFFKFAKSIIIPSLFYISFNGRKDFSTLSQLESKYNYSHLPMYSRKEVAEHYNSETRIWVIFRDGVYDITDFINVHPGGSEKILMAAGGYLDVFWAMYSFHLTSDFVFEILHKYRIGNLNPNDVLKESDIPNFSKLKKEKSNNRSQKLIKHHSFPYCAESPQSQLINYFYTPNDFFFVRNHNSIPEQIPVEDYSIEIEMPNKDVLEVKLIELLKNIKSTQKSTLLACSGLRRKHFGPSVKGIQWKSGAIGNGIWEGISVKDLFSYIGYNYNDNELDKLHFQCYGLDKDFQGEHYNVSIPLKEALDQGILANKYNHENIPFDHGYPVRFIIPGFIGVRNVKWLKKIKISYEEAQGSFQQRDYKIFPNNMDVSLVDLSKVNPVMTWEVSSSICSPDEDSNLNLSKHDDLILKGWGFGTKGTELFKIELSFDKGHSWRQIPNDNLRFDVNDDGKVFSWTTWNYKINKDELKKYLIYGKLNAWVKATDLLGNTQPLNSDEIINFRGLMNNSIHKVNYNLI